MADIEFFTGDEPPETLGPGEEISGAARTRRPVAVDLLALAPPALYAAAAALSMVAPFEKVMRIGETTPNAGVLTYSTDGWGRLDIATAAGIHDARYGIAFSACAGGFVLIAVALATTLVLPALRKWTKLLAAAGLAVTSALGGVLAALALSIDAAFDNQRTAAQSDVGGHPELSLRYGWCLWLGIAALAAGLLGVVLTVLGGRAEEHPAGFAERPGKLT